MTYIRPFLVACLLFVFPSASSVGVHGDDQIPSQAQLEFFEKEVRPLLDEHCYQCHSAEAERVEADLLLDSRQAHLRGGDSGAAIVPGDADASLLIEAVRYESYEMPPKGKLPDADIAILARWVEMGAPWPQEAEPTGDTDKQQFDLEKRKSEFWVWQPLAAAKPPQVANGDWPRNTVDRFTLARLEKAGIAPAPDADHLAILRRLYFDLIGLPPTPEEIAAFLADDDPQSIERVIDRLLDSPHFGERWGRHWLDLVRYAESRGHEFDNDAPNAFQYRDYVIRALNADIPYDQFVREHIAGDLLPQPRIHPEHQFNESVLGTGFWFLGEWVHSPVDVRKDEADRFDNMIDVMSKTFLGVTVACARCHDHKFDAISTADYYSLSGFLQSSDYRQVRFESMEQNRRIAERLAHIDAQYQEKILKWLQKKNVALPSAVRSDEDPAVILDYATLARPQFMQDGYIFGQAPRRAGRPYLNSNTDAVDIATFDSAVNDPAWHGLESITAGTVENMSEVAKLPKSGRTLRSPTFELTHGTVHCRVKGAGHIVACVDSHRLVAGPLHKETIVRVSPDQNWARLKLDRYVGHRLHLEFIPAADQQLNVRMVVQGLNDEELAQLDQRLAVADKPYEDFARAAEALLNGPPKVTNTERVFADFESGTYEGWTVTGEAFGQAPQTLETIASYQGKINGVGKFFVNSHNVRPDGDPQNGDRLTGTLTSSEFKIDFDSIEFLVGGGAHSEKTCVNLIIDEQVVLSATGASNNQMSLTQWDVRPFTGKHARIQIVDDHRKGWGNIGVDHIVFKTFAPPADSSEASQSLHAEARQIIEAWKRERESLASQIVRRSHVALAMMDGTGEDDHILIRGNSSKPGKPEPRHFLTAIAGDSPMQIDQGSGRLALARQINAPSNPLTSRVIVNRVWHHLMGRGIVPTVDDFGFLGQRPTHPQLLDHLAVWFLEDGRSLKRLIKYIAMSRTYQLSSHAIPESRQADPSNLLWHHCPPKRLQGEVIRDSLLSLSGRLDKTAFGPPVPIHLTPFMDGRGRPKSSGPVDGAGRRSIYVAVRRNFLSPFMLAFDTPAPFSTMGRRNVSNVPAQALILLNDPLVAELASGWGDRALEAVAGAGQAAAIQRIQWMYLSGFGRKSTDQEQNTALAFLETQAAESDLALESSELWSLVAHALVNTKEFVFLR